MITSRIAIVMVLCLFGEFAAGQDFLEPASVPAADLSTPKKALAAYFAAEKTIDLAALQKLTVITAPERNGYVDRVANFQLWAHYLERAAIHRFGKEEGLKVEGHARSLDDQLALDVERLKTANVQLSDDDSTAKVFLAVEPHRPEGLQIDRFHFLDVYDLRKTEEGWKVDYLRTYGCLDRDKQQLYGFEANLFPRMAKAMTELAAGVKAGKFAKAEALKVALEAKWQEAYDAIEKERAAAGQPTQ